MLPGRKQEDHRRNASIAIDNATGDLEGAGRQLNERKFRLLLAAFSITAQAVAFVQFRMQFSSLGLPAKWNAQFTMLLALSLCLGLLLPWCRKPQARWAIFGLQAVIILIIGLPLGRYLGTELTLIMALILEVYGFAGIWNGLIASAALIVLMLISQGHVVAWGLNTVEPSVHDRFAFGLYAFLVTVLGALISYQRRSQVSNAELNRRLYQATSNLAEANLLLQEHVVRSGQEAEANERKRLAREYHDTLGYTLTNVVMMLEAATDLAAGDRDILLEHLYRARDQAKEGLDEICKSIQTLRAAPSLELTGIPAIQRLVGAFSEATHIDVRLNLDERLGSFGQEIDWAIYRLVQEGITNALRHGLANGITISFFRRSDGLSIWIKDNGIGAGELKEGYGLLGMRERLGRLGGTLEVYSRPGDGFLLSAWIPLQDECA